MILIMPCQPHPALMKGNLQFDVHLLNIFSTRNALGEKQYNGKRKLLKLTNDPISGEINIINIKVLSIFCLSFFIHILHFTLRFVEASINFC